MIAIIPARGGSKGVPKKNIKRLAGKPLICWTVEAALKSKKIDKVILSTDSEEIINACKAYNIEVPFIRPKELALDNSLAIDNYIYTVKRLNNVYKYNINSFVVLQPTSPFRNSEHIDKAINLFESRNADSLVSCCQLLHPIEWVMSIDKNDIINTLDTDQLIKNRQSLDKKYIPNGAIFILKLDLLISNRSYYSENTIGYIMDEQYSLDIDTHYDLVLAETMLKAKII